MNAEITHIISANQHIILLIAPIVFRFVHYGIRIRHIVKFSGQGWPTIATWGACYFSSAGLLLYLFSTQPNLWTNAAVLENPAYYLLWVASLLRIFGLEQLGQSFHEDIVVEKDQKLIQSGFYAILRHPLHIFLQLEIASMVWFIDRITEENAFKLCWAFVATGIVTTISHEIKEEKALVKAFGKEYLEYMRKSWGFTDLLPFYLPTKQD